MNLLFGIKVEFDCIDRIIIFYRYPVESDLVLQTFASQCKSEEETDWLQELILVGQNAAKYRVCLNFL